MVLENQKSETGRQKEDRPGKFSIFYWQYTTNNYPTQNKIINGGL